MFAILVFFIVGGTRIQATEFYMVFEDTEIYSDCTDGPPGSIGVREAFDLTNMTFEMDEEGVHISGNHSIKWDFPRTDRLSARYTIFRESRGSWQPTVYSVYTPDFCSSILNENQSWFKYWYKNIVNREDLREKCITTKGTIFVYNPFTMSMRLSNVNVPNAHGRFKVVFTFEAFDENDVRRPTSMCFEIRGEAEKVVPN